MEAWKKVIFVNSIKVRLQNGEGKMCIRDSRKTVFTAPAVDVELTAGNVVMLGSITVKVRNT